MISRPFLSISHYYVARSSDVLTEINTFRPIQFGTTVDEPTVVGIETATAKRTRRFIAAERRAISIIVRLRRRALISITVSWGTSDNKSVRGDFDGDGKTDVAVFRNGIYYILSCGGAATYVSFGAAGDVPTASAFVQ